MFLVVLVEARIAVQLVQDDQVATTGARRSQALHRRHSPRHREYLAVQKIVSGRILNHNVAMFLQKQYVKRLKLIRATAEMSKFFAEHEVSDFCSPLLT